MSLLMTKQQTFSPRAYQLSVSSFLRPSFRFVLVPSACEGMITKKDSPGSLH
ncbi:hypothetical protein RchiOBHm_Chr2g0098281 [Rosa chinensis]|uniref:Uncharacterized protein n=1 Tax=Rosa chinensis TaxID=74649 RepID=A0A2P6RLK4_ROSCH|nr:hypothetical protein RchiOBHm_Chr2g0098281 [Rosa chinensis]